MQQYIQLLKDIQEKGTYKPAAREGMPGTQSLFGYQFRHNLQDGFPLLTTKKMFWKGIVLELIWFLRGDTNIKFLVDNGVNIWNEDAYNYYCKTHCKYPLLNFESFINKIKTGEKLELDPVLNPGYDLGDCGFQYGKVWRRWGTQTLKTAIAHTFPEISDRAYESKGIDQIQNLLDGLRNNPEGRRHIVTAIDPVNDKDLALYWCHAMFQFNCRTLSFEEKIQWVMRHTDVEMENLAITEEACSDRTPKYYLDCQLYQRSADAVLGVPFNIASYALLTHLIAEMCNMIPGEFIHSFGDVHIYDNHKEAVEEQLSRKPVALPKLKIMFKGLHECDVNYLLNDFIKKVSHEDFIIENYNHMPAIKAELSTGLKK